MNILRLAAVCFTTLRYGLDEIVIRAFAPPWFARIWLTLMFWRPLPRPRALRLREALEHLGPIFVKFGQVLSTRQDILPDDLASELAQLQDQVKPQPFTQIKAVIEKSYGRPLEEIFSTIAEQPLGSASVAQVHRATLLDGQVVAVKVLRPNISQQIAKDISLMNSFAWLVEKLYRDGERLRPRAIVAEFHNSLQQETDLLHEAANCNQLRRNFANYDMIRIPVVHWNYCTHEVMAMELLEGIPVDQIADLQAAKIDLPKLARAGIEIFFTQVFRDSFFHADMHPGNIMVDQQGRFVVVDYGIMGSLAEVDKEYIGANFLAFFNRDYRKVAQMHVEAGWTPPDTSVPQFEAAIRAVCEPIFARPLREISFGRLLLQLFHVARKFNLIVQPQLILLQKTLLNIEGIGRQLAPDLNLWESAKPFLEDWARKRNSPQHVFGVLKDNASAMISLLPEVPMALRINLRNAQGHNQAVAKEIAQLKRHQRYLWLVCTGLVALVAYLWLA